MKSRFCAIVRKFSGSTMILQNRIPLDRAGWRVVLSRARAPDGSRLWAGWSVGQIEKESESDVQPNQKS